jgi:uncharacterized sulfatase
MIKLPLLVVVLLSPAAALRAGGPAARPNILIAISDDQSHRHTSTAGYKAVNTPAFDRVAREGVLFLNSFAASPGCSPSRAALLTGRHPWQIEQAGTHGSSFPAKYVAFPELLEKSGYFIGMTGKGWGPGSLQGERKRNPAGPEFKKRTAKIPKSAERISPQNSSYVSLRSSAVSLPPSQPGTGNNLKDLKEPKHAGWNFGFRA